MSEGEWKEEIKFHHDCLIALIISVVDLIISWEKKQYEWALLDGSPVLHIRVSIALSQQKPCDLGVSPECSGWRMSPFSPLAQLFIQRSFAVSQTQIVSRYWKHRVRSQVFLNSTFKSIYESWKNTRHIIFLNISEIY